jgi:hypothetical protein
MPELEERIAVLEVQQRNIEVRLTAMGVKVDEMHSVLLQAKGARWAILGVASLAGFLAGKASTIMNFFSIPK